jgi:hypothetical protein
MASMRILNLLWCLHLFAAAPPVVTAANPDAGTIPFDAGEDGTVVVPVRIDGAGPFRFLVDTGSTHSAIVEKLAGKLGLRPSAKAAITSASGQSMRPVVRLGSTAVGRAARDGLLASLLTSADLERAGLTVDGVLGQDFLAGFDYTIDYQRGALTWDVEPATGHPAARLPMTTDGGRFLVELPQGAGRGTVRLVPDSGSSALVIFERARRANAGTLRLQTMTGSTRMSGVAGERSVERAIVRDLRVGDLVLHNEPAVVVDADEGSDVAADGLLPLHRFARVSYHAREQCLSIWGR